MPDASSYQPWNSDEVIYELGPGSTGYTMTPLGYFSYNYYFNPNLAVDQSGNVYAVFRRAALTPPFTGLYQFRPSGSSWTYTLLTNKNSTLSYGTPIVAPSGSIYSPATSTDGSDIETIQKFSLKYRKIKISCSAIMRFFVRGRVGVVC